MVFSQPLSLKLFPRHIHLHVNSAEYSNPFPFKALKTADTKEI